MSSLAPAPPGVGALVPDITAKNQFGADVTLSQAVASETDVLLVFYPFAFSGICTRELATLQEARDRLTARGVRVVGVSCDPMFTQRAWAEHEGYDMDLLSDFWPHGRVARAYGVFDADAGFAVRGTFLVDAAMRLRHSLVAGPGETRDFAAFFADVDRLAQS